MPSQNASCRIYFPLYVSQDGASPNEEVASLAKNFSSRGVSYLHHKEEKKPVKLSKKELLAYYRIANHYKFIIQTIFDCFGYQRLIIVEVSSPRTGGTDLVALKMGLN